MAQLIIGHTTDTEARIWVRGDTWHSLCEVAVRSSKGRTRQQKDLFPETDHTHTFDFKELTPDTEYAVTATFSVKPAIVSGRFRTLAQPARGKPLSFSFVLSSCNLSVVSINNFLALLLAGAGAATALSSLDLPVERWRAPRFAWLWRLVRWPLKKLLEIIAWVTEKVTGMKQPGPPYLRSPFLKLSAVFDSWVVDLACVTSVPAVGDVVSVGSAPDAEGATGVVACSPTVEGPAEDTLGDGEIAGGRCRLVLTQVEGTLRPHDLLFRRSQTASDTEKQPERKQVGIIRRIWRGKPWYQRPSFFIEAGDQIYYDFPVPKRPPDRDEYRIAYREAWSYDVSKRHLLSHWPHYMTLDDHEIADQFARDFTPPVKDVSPDTYLQEATVAYRGYALAMGPPFENDVDRARMRTGPYWYRFDKGITRFFVLDTQTRRWNRSSPPQMIDDDQMCRLLQWMTVHKDDLKFVVTSVPFVAEINEAENERAPRWHQNVGSQPGADPLEAAGPAEAAGNRENDKWSASRFTQQRRRIIEHIATNNIERLVFLTGDMHCCYHATMRITRSKRGRIGPECKYQSLTIHELAGGPVNQLQLAESAAFDTRSTGCIPKSREDEDIITYEVVLDRFHSEVNAVMHLAVEYVEREQLPRLQHPRGATRTGAGGALDRAFTPEVQWSVIRTLTDNDASAWPVMQKTAGASPPSKDNDAPTSPEKPEPAGASTAWNTEPVMTGRISFVKKRLPTELSLWSEETREVNGNP